jgi:hypothetical protein
MLALQIGFGILFVIFVFVSAISVEKYNYHPDNNSDNY